MTIYFIKYEDYTYRSTRQGDDRIRNQTMHYQNNCTHSTADSTRDTESTTLERALKFMDSRTILSMTFSYSKKERKKDRTWKNPDLMPSFLVVQPTQVGQRRKSTRRSSQIRPSEPNNSQSQTLVTPQGKPSPVPTRSKPPLLRGRPIQMIANPPYAQPPQSMRLHVATVLKEKNLATKSIH